MTTSAAIAASGDSINGRPRAEQRTQAARKAPLQQAAKPQPQQLAAMSPQAVAKPELHPIIPPDPAKPTPRAASPQRRPRLPQVHRAGAARPHRSSSGRTAHLDLSPGASIAGSGRISRHASGNAVDFNAGDARAMVRWLIANHQSGGTMTYAGMSHIHVDIGQHFVALNSGGGR